MMPLSGSALQVCLFDGKDSQIDLPVHAREYALLFFTKNVSD